MESYLLFVILIGTLVAATVSKRIRETIISLPMVYTLFGLLVAVIFPNLSDLGYDSPVVEAISFFLRRHSGQHDFDDQNVTTHRIA